MKSELVKKETKQQYPCLMKFKDNDRKGTFIVLFNVYGSGVIVYTERNDNSSVGSYYSAWDMNNFTLTNDKIILSNE